MGSSHVRPFDQGRLWRSRSSTARKSKAEPLVAEGATGPTRRKAVAAASDVVFSIVGFPSDVREVILGDRRSAGRLEDRQHPGRHDHQRAVAGASKSPRRRKARGVHSVDAPVSGGDVGARSHGCRS